MRFGLGQSNPHLDHPAARVGQQRRFLMPDRRAGTHVYVRFSHSASVAEAVANCVSRVSRGLVAGELIMAFGYRPVDRDQMMLLPPDLRDWLPPRHFVWFLL